MKKSNLWMIAITAALVCAAAIALLPGKSDDDGANAAAVQMISAGEALRIDAAEVGASASFYPVEVDGTEMEIMAVRASDGTIRTAFNTCQSCFASGAGYYVQEDTDLVCQNCGFHFTPDQVEIQAGGCNPWPIFPENKTTTADSIEISYDFLRNSAAIFANWKG